MSEIEFPAVLVLSAIRRRNGGPAEVVSFADGKILQTYQDLGPRLTTYQVLEQRGAAPYTYTLAEVSKAAEVVEEQRRALEFEAGLRASPDPDPDPIDQVAELARAKWAGQPAMLARVERALELARAGAVKELGGGQWEVTGQSGTTYHVNGGCECPDYAHNGNGGYCKHRIAVALVLRARGLQKEGIGTVASSPIPEQAPEGTQTQPQDTTIPDLAQVLGGAIAIWPRWAGPGARIRYQDGRDLEIPSLDYDGLAAEARAQGMRPGVNDYYYLPAEVA